MQQFYLGIDVAKKKLSACLFDAAGNRLWSNVDLPNTPSGFKTLVQRATEKAQKSSSGEPFSIAAGMESTGVYGEKLCHYLYENNEEGRITVYVLQAAAVKHYATALQTANKNDRVDAKVIAAYLKMSIQEGTERPFKMPSESTRRLRDLSRRREELLKLIGIEENHLESLRCGAGAAEFVKESVEQSLDFLKQQLEEVEREMQKHIKDDPDLQDRIKLLQTIPGVGDITSALLESETGGLLQFQNAKQLVSYAGLAPKEYTSGTSVYKQTKISRKGNAHIRKGLFMACKTAVRHNPLLRAYYQRLRARGKAWKPTMVACMRKLLHIIWGMFKSGKAFDPTYGC